MSTTIFCDRKLCYISAQEFLGPIVDCNDSNCISECQRVSEDCFSSCDGDVHLLIFEPSSDPDSGVPRVGTLAERSEGK